MPPLAQCRPRRKPSFASSSRRRWVLLLLLLLLLCLLTLLLGRVDLGAQRPIVIKLSRGRSVGRSVCPSVCLSSALWKKGGSDPDAVWHRRSDGSRDEAGFGDRSTGRGYFWGRIWGAPWSTGTYCTYVCYSAATRPSCQITLRRLVNVDFVCVLKWSFKTYVNAVEPMKYGVF